MRFLVRHELVATYGNHRYTSPLPWKTPRGYTGCLPLASFVVPLNIRTEAYCLAISMMFFIYLQKNYALFLINFSLIKFIPFLSSGYF